MYSVKAYNVTISLNVEDGNLRCCGARSLSGFQVKGNDSRLTKIKTNKMLRELYRKVRLNHKHVLVAAEAIGPRGWDSAGGGTSRTAKLSLENFCEVNGFKKVPGGVNPNNKHEICVYVDQPMYLDGDGVKEKPIPPAQKFPEVKRKKPSGDIEKMADAIIRIVRGEE